MRYARGGCTNGSLGMFEVPSRPLGLVFKVWKFTWIGGNMKEAGLGASIFLDEYNIYKYLDPPRGAKLMGKGATKQPLRV